MVPLQRLKSNQTFSIDYLNIQCIDTSITYINMSFIHCFNNGVISIVLKLVYR